MNFLIYKMNAKNCVAGFVLYDPENDVFLESIRQCVQGGFVVVVFDNSTTEEIRSKNRDCVRSVGAQNVVYISEQCNIGLSAAYNKIIVNAEALLLDYDAIVLFDQDSVVAAAELTRLYQNYLKFQQRFPVGVYAAYAHDRHRRPYRIESFGKPMANGQVFSVKYAPASFSIFSRKAFEKVGVFYDDFFIDYIDVDFSQRCRRNGLNVVLDTSVKFVHSVGEGDVKVFGNRLTPLSSPYRVYYQTRNLILSYHRLGASFFFMWKQLVRRFAAVLVSGVANKDLVARVSFFLRGTRDGVSGRAGVLPRMDK